MFRGRQNKNEENAPKMEKCLCPIGFLFFFLFFFLEWWLIVFAKQSEFATLFVLVADVVTELILYTDDFILEIIHLFFFRVDNLTILYNV